MQRQFNPSKLFAPWISTEKSIRDRESHNQRKRRREKAIQVKIGHGGTLDPLATGVLITGVGKGTKKLQDFLLCTKTYEAVVLFGASTDSYDRLGKILRNAPYEHITRDMVEKALEQYRQVHAIATVILGIEDEWKAFIRICPRRKADTARD